MSRIDTFSYKQLRRRYHNLLFQLGMAFEQAEHPPDARHVYELRDEIRRCVARMRGEFSAGTSSAMSALWDSLKDHMAKKGGAA